MKGRRTFFLKVLMVGQHSCNPPVCIVMRPAGLLRLWLGLAEDTPANNKPKTLPLVSRPLSRKPIYWLTLVSTIPVSAKLVRTVRECLPRGRLGRWDSCL